MKYLFVLFCSILGLVILPCSRLSAHQSVVTVEKTTHSIEKNKYKKSFKIWKIKKRHSNPAPIFLIIALVGVGAAIAVYLLTPMVVLAAVLGGIGFIGFILYFVYSGAN